MFQYWDEGLTSLIIVTSDGVIITDPSFGERAVRLLKQVEELSDLPISTVIYTTLMGIGESIMADHPTEIIAHDSCRNIFPDTLLGSTKKLGPTKYYENHH